MTAIQNLKALYLDNHRLKYPSFPENARYAPPYTDKTSNGLTKCIIEFLRLKGCQAERISNTGRMIDQTKVYTDVVGCQRQIGSTKWLPGTGTNGTADISATISGLSVKIEVKCLATKDRQRPAQIEYQKQIEAAGGIYFIASTFEHFYDWFLNFTHPANIRAKYQNNER